MGFRCFPSCFVKNIWKIWGASLPILSSNMPLYCNPRKPPYFHFLVLKSYEHHIFFAFFWGVRNYMTFHKIQFNNPYGIPFNSLQTTTFLQFFMVKIPFQSHSTTCFRLRMLQISEKIHQWLINPKNTHKDSNSFIHFPCVSWLFSMFSHVCFFPRAPAKGSS